MGALARYSVVSPPCPHIELLGAACLAAWRSDAVIAVARSCVSSRAREYGLHRHTRGAPSSISNRCVQPAATGVQQRRICCRRRLDAGPFLSQSVHTRGGLHAVSCTSNTTPQLFALICLMLQTGSKQRVGFPVLVWGHAIQTHAQGSQQHQQLLCPTC
jgi:hypothetical protein